MDKEWIGIVGVLAGTLVGGAVTYFLEKFRSKRDRYSEWVDLRRVKFEAIAEVAEQMRLGYAEVTIAARRWAHGDPEALKALKFATPPIARLGVLTRLYAPELEPEFQALLRNIQTLNGEVAKFSTHHRTNNVEENMAKVAPLAAEQAKVDQNCSALIVALTKAAKALEPEKP